jgi:hypothetical protein
MPSEHQAMKTTTVADNYQESKPQSYTDNRNFPSSNLTEVNRHLKSLQNSLLQYDKKSYVSPKAMAAAESLAIISRTQSGRRALSSVLQTVKNMIIRVLEISSEPEPCVIKQGHVKENKMVDVYTILLRVMKNMALSNDILDKFAVLECGGIPIFLDSFMKPNMGNEVLLESSCGLRGLCESPSIREKISSDENKPDSFEGQHSNSGLSFEGRPSRQMVAQSLMVLMQNTPSSDVQIDPLMSLIHLLDAASVQAAVLANTNFLKHLASLLRNDAEPALQLLAASGIAVCVNGNARALRAFINAAGPLVLAEAADRVLTGAEHGQVALTTSGAFQKLMDLFISLDAPSQQPADTSTCPADIPADFGLIANAVTERQIFSRYKSLIVSLAVTPWADNTGGPPQQHGDSASSTEPFTEPARAAPELGRIPAHGDRPRLPDQPDVGSPPPARDREPAEKGRPELSIRPFGWSFRGALVPDVVKRSPRPPERGAARPGWIPRATAPAPRL